MAQGTRIPLWVKLAVGASLIAVVPVLAIGAWAMQVNAEALKSDARELQLAVADDLAQQIELDVEAARRGLSTVAQALVDPAAR